MLKTVETNRILRKPGAARVAPLPAAEVGEPMLARCPECGNTFEVLSWKPGLRCQACGRPGVVPVPLIMDQNKERTVTRTHGVNKGDSRLGRLAVWSGLISYKDLNECLEIQRDFARRGIGAPQLGELLVKKGYMAREQLDGLLKAQRLAVFKPGETTFGELAAKNRLLSEAQRNECVKIQKTIAVSGRIPPLLGEIAIERGFMTEKQVYAVLVLQQKQRDGILVELEKQTKPAAMPRVDMANWVPSRRTGIRIAAVAGAAILSVVAVFGLAGGPTLCEPQTRWACDACTRSFWGPINVEKAMPCPLCGKDACSQTIRAFCRTCRGPLDEYRVRYAVKRPGIPGVREYRVGNVWSVSEPRFRCPQCRQSQAQTVSTDVALRFIPEKAR